jgi:DNA-binding transcriptional LysR family regulator
MKLIQFKIFKDLAQEKSFIKVAHLNYLTQPSISTYLKQLEDELGVKLFDRAPKRVELTREGHLYLKHVEEILQKCQDLVNLPIPEKFTPKGEIRIASIHSIGMYGIGSFLRLFMKTYPKIRIHLEYQDAYKVYDLVQKKKVHIGLIAFPEKHLHVNYQIYGYDELGVVVPSSHSLSHKSQIQLSDLNNQDFIAFDTNTPTRHYIDTFFKKHKIKVEIKMTNNNIFALKKAIEAEIGLSIIPWNTISDEVEKGTLKKLFFLNQTLKRPLALLTAKRVKNDSTTGFFIDSLKAYNVSKK